MKLQDGLYTTMEEAKDWARDHGDVLIVRIDVDNRGTAYAVFDRRNMFDVFDDAPDEHVEYAFAIAKDGIEFDELKNLVYEGWNTSEDEDGRI